jgi:hypothetical protein
MTNEKINIAIAEACGFHQEEPWSNGSECWGHKDYPPHVGFENIPNYCNDLNAMHEAEKVFDTALYCRYINELCDLTIKGNNSMYMATSHQRAEAFLKTINKWEGGSDE